MARSRENLDLEEGVVREDMAPTSGSPWVNLSEDTPQALGA